MSYATYSEFLMTRPYARSEMARVVLQAAQFAHVPTVKVLDFAARQPINFGWFDYQTYTDWVGVQADDFLRAFAFEHGTLCPVCLTPLANDEPRVEVHGQWLLPGWVQYRGDASRLELYQGTHISCLHDTDSKGTAHKQCEWVGQLLHRLCSYADRPCMDEIAANAYYCHVLLDLFHEASTFLRRGVRYRRFRDFVAGRQVPLRFNPRKQSRPIPTWDGPSLHYDVRRIPEDA